MVWVTGGTLAGTVGSPEEEVPSSAETRGSRAAPPPARGRRGGWETRRHAAINIHVNIWFQNKKYLPPESLSWS